METTKMGNKITAGLLTLTAKIGPKLLSVVAKIAKIGKVGLALGSLASYTYFFSWKFAVMVMILLFVHESGHLWAMKRCGMKTKGIYFLPFLGAVAVTDDVFKSRKDEVYVAIMGPIWGFLLSGFVGLLYIKTGDMLFGVASGWMATINLFNLLPINPLDGGRILKSIVFSINSRLGLAFLILGIFITTFIIYWSGIFLFFILLVVGSLEFIGEYYARNPNRIVKKSIEDLNKLVGQDPPIAIKNEAENIKSTLLDKKVDNVTKIERYQKLIIEKNKIIVEDVSKGIVLGHIANRIKSFESIPRMNFKLIVLSIISYIMTAVVLWTLMGYMNHIPEVEIARKLFMS